jgi:hypothetical protein
MGKEKRTKDDVCFECDPNDKKRTKLTWTVVREIDMNKLELINQKKSYENLLKEYQEQIPLLEERIININKRIEEIESIEDEKNQ